MSAVASTVCIVNVRERLLRRNVGGVHAIAEQVVRGHIERRPAENAAYAHPLNNIDHVIGKTAAVWEPCSVASDQAQPLALRR
jgi:hypothetical protein